MESSIWLLRSSRILVLVGALTTTMRSSASAQTEARSVTVRDPEAITPARVSAEPALRLGAVSGDEAQEFDRVVGVLRTGSGAILVADEGAAQIRIFDSDGTLLRTLGRRGQGPGELESLQRMFLVADAVYAWDDRLGRLTTFSPSGTLVRTVGLQRASSTGRLAPVGVPADGAILGRVRKASF